MTQANSKSKAINKSFSVTERTIEQLGKLQVKFDAMSPSEALRRAVNQVFEKEFPDYIYNKSATDLSKRRAMESEYARETMDDREYLDNFVEGGVYGKLKDGTEVYFIHAFTNNLELIPVKNAKEYLAKDPGLIDIHKNKLLEGTQIEPLLKPSMVRYIESGFNVELSDETKKIFGIVNEEEESIGD